MSRIGRFPACWSMLVVLLACLGSSPSAHAQSGGVTFWNRLEGGLGSVPSEVGPSLYYYDPSIDGGSGMNDVVGNPVFVAGKFGNGVTLGPGDYYSQGRVHGLVLRGVSSVLSSERGTIAVWYKEKERPAAYEHNSYKLFDGGFGLDSPVQLANNADFAPGNLYFLVTFGGEQNYVYAPFSPVLDHWVHVAAVWDRAGIGGTAETARLYVDGVKVGAITTSSWGTTFQGNRADIAGGGDVMDDKFALDNLVLYSFAKTDFSDRFDENPGTGEVTPGLVIPTAAHLSGSLGSNWRTDVEVHNPSSTAAAYTIELLKHDADNSAPDARSFTLAAGVAARHTDVVLHEFGFTGKAALRVTATQGEILVTSRTYNRLGASNPTGLPAGSTYGEFVPALPDDQAIAASGEGRLLQLSHTNPNLKTDYRTNVGVVNAGGGTIEVVVDLYTAAGSVLGSVQLTIPPYGYHQLDSILGPFAGTPIEDAYAVVRCTTSGGRFHAYASVIDNRSGAPVFIPAARRGAGRL
jgi:hypothetical protein